MTSLSVLPGFVTNGLQAVLPFKVFSVEGSTDFNIRFECVVNVCSESCNGVCVLVVEPCSVSRILSSPFKYFNFYFPWNFLFFYCWVLCFFHIYSCIPLNYAKDMNRTERNSRPQKSFIKKGSFGGEYGKRGWSKFLRVLQFSVR